jgi:hypothetical protein
MINTSLHFGCESFHLKGLIKGKKIMVIFCFCIQTKKKKKKKKGIICHNKFIIPKEKNFNFSKKVEENFGTF